jgi:hypothetical protein
VGIKHKTIMNQTQKELVITLKQKMKVCIREAIELRTQQRSCIQSKNTPLSNILGGDALELEVKSRVYQEVVDMIELPKQNKKIVSG